MVVAEENPKVESDEESSTKETQAKSLFTLPILKIIKEAQQQHGLRHSDYQRYRSYCTRRIRRLRKTLHLPQGDKRHYKRRDVTEAHLKDKRFLYIPLMVSERAWSYAMQLREEANTEPRKKCHMICRLTKACKHALQLEELCKSDLCDARSKLEAKAYVAWMNGTLYFELQVWQKAMDHLQQAQMVYSRLEEAVGESDKPIYKQKVEELQPSLRYCAYNIGDSSAISDLQTMRNALANDIHMLNKLDALMEEARGTLKNVEEVEWRGRKISVPLTNVGAFIAADQQLDNIDADSLERHLIKCKDAISSVRDFIQSEQGDSAACQMLLTYLIHIRLSRTVQRTLMLIEITNKENYKAQDLVRLYEMVLQNLAEMQQLQGMENDEGFQSGIESDVNKYKTYRCYYISEALKITKHYKEAHEILDRALFYAKSVKTKEVDELINMIEMAKCVALAEIALNLDSASETSNADVKYPPKGGGYLVDRLDEYCDDISISTKNPRIIPFPPPLMPIPYKPLFFDVAVNQIKFPSLEEKLHKPDKQQGISGFVKGLWGGWGTK